MNDLTKQTIKAIQEDITAALVSVGEKHGVKLSMGRGSFSPESAKLIVNVAVIGESGEAYTPYADDLKQYGTMFGVNPSIGGKSFTYRSELYTVLGLDVKKRKMPIICKRAVDGKQFKFGVELQKLVGLEG